MSGIIPDAKPQEAIQTPGSSFQQAILVGLAVLLQLLQCFKTRAALVLLEWFGSLTGGASDSRTTKRYLRSAVSQGPRKKRRPVRTIRRHGNIAGPKLTAVNIA